MTKQKEKIVHYSSEEIRRMSQQKKWQSDWKKADSITNEQLEEMVKNDPDNRYLTDDQASKGTFYRKGEWAKQFEEPQKKTDYPLPG